MDFRLMRYFIAVADELHFTRAAARLGIAQPALSHEIRQLERVLGTPLFTRSQRSVRLTEAGVVLLPEARAILRRVETATALVARAAKGQIGRVRIGFAFSSAVDLPRAVNAYRKRFPDIHVQVRELSAGRQVEAILDDDLDVGLLQDFVKLPTGVRSVFLRREQLLVALPASHPFAQRSRVSLADFEGEPLILGPRRSHAFTDLIVAACAKAGFAPHIVHETAEVTSRLLLVASGVGITFILKSSMHPSAESVVYRPVVGQPVSFKLTAVSKVGPQPASTVAFIETLREVTRVGSR